MLQLENIKFKRRTLVYILAIIRIKMDKHVCLISFLMSVFSNRYACVYQTNTVLNRYK